MNVEREALNRQVRNLEQKKFKTSQEHKQLATLKRKLATITES